MDNQTLIIIVLVAVVAALAVALLLQRKRSDQLRSRFGPEYERAVEETGDKRRAEAELHQRAKRVEKLPIRPLEPADRQRFIEAWRQVQADFVDDPQRSIGHADQLLQDVMSARGYPISDFDQAAADVSVDHPTVVHHFRAGHDIALRHQRGETNTEDLRQAMIHYRELFGDELTGDGE
jgi:hypothetical protein